MHRVLMLTVALAVCGCSGEYSRVPEPTGEWVPVNPPSFYAEATPPAPLSGAIVLRPVSQRRWVGAQR
jgi:hypothetical protein